MSCTTVIVRPTATPVLRITPTGASTLSVNSSPVTTTIQSMQGERSWKEKTINVTQPTTVVTDDKFKGAIKSWVIVDGVVIVWAKSGVTRNTTTGTLDFSASGIVVNDHLIFEWK